MSGVGWGGVVMLSVYLLDTGFVCRADVSDIHFLLPFDKMWGVLNYSHCCFGTHIA